MSFALMEEWTNIQEKEVADMLIHEALFTAYLHETRSDTKSNCDCALFSVQRMHV